jgi:hypothetical protein
LLSAFMVLLTLNACNNNHFEADISDVKAEISIHRFDLEIRKLTPENSKEMIQEFQNKYGIFYDIFNRKILQLGTPENPTYAPDFYNFVMYNEAEGIFEACDKTFGDFSKQKRQLTKLFRHYKYYFPKDTLPEIITFMSGFNHSAVTVDNYLAFALDKYLGSDSPFYSGADRYLRKRMDKAYIPTDAAGAWAEQKYPKIFDNPTLFQEMIHQGKTQYFIHSMLPEYPDTLRWMYTSKQLDWAERNEANIWNHLAEDKLLFSTDRMTIRQYTETAPFTIPLSDVSAPRAAVYVGYKIVLSYMKNNPQISLKTLMEEEDYQKILSAAKYHP